MKMELKSIGYWSLLKISFIVNLFVGFVVGLFFAIFMGLFLSIAEKFGSMPMMGDEIPPIGFLIIIYPIMFSLGAAFFNTILYLMIAFIYNMTAKLLGGLELNFNEVVEVSPSIQYQHSSSSKEQIQAVKPIAPPPPIEPLPDRLTPPSERDIDDKEL